MCAAEQKSRVESLIDELARAWPANEAVLKAEAVKGEGAAAGERRLVANRAGLAAWGLALLRAATADRPGKALREGLAFFPKGALTRLDQIEVREPPAAESAPRLIGAAAMAILIFAVVVCYLVFTTFR